MFIVEFYSFVNYSVIYFVNLNIFFIMADIFTKTDARRLLEKKNVWLFGDSNMRGIYKDIIWLLEKNSLISLNSLRGKLEGSFLHDSLIKGGVLHHGRNYQEIRRYKNFSIDLNIEFTFLTQCMSKDIQKKLNGIATNGEVPDVIVLNSCLWDITRWGPDGVEKYKKNILALMKLLKNVLPYQTRVVWLTTPPVSHEPRGGFFIKQIDFLKHTLRFDIMEANFFVSREVILHGFDVVDIHYHLLLQIHRRRPDGIHWSPEAMRHITNLLLTHLCVSWGCRLPQNFKSPLLRKLQEGSDARGCKGAKPTKLLKFVLDVPKSSSITLPQNIQSRKNRGKKRKRRRSNARDQNCNDFTKDVFDYDYKKKRFKLAPGRHC